MENKVDIIVVKRYLKSLSPLKALELIKDSKIPTPYKEVIIAVCVNRLSTFRAIDFLEKEYGIVLGFYTFGRRLKQGLKMISDSCQ